MEKDLVKITCYGKTKTYERKEAISHFLECMMFSDGSEQNRYTRIYTALICGFKEITDEE